MTTTTATAYGHCRRIFQARPQHTIDRSDGNEQCWAWTDTGHAILLQRNSAADYFEVDVTDARTGDFTLDREVRIAAEGATAFDAEHDEWAEFTVPDDMAAQLAAAEPLPAVGVTFGYYDPHLIGIVYFGETDDELPGILPNISWLVREGHQQPSDTCLTENPDWLDACGFWRHVDADRLRPIDHELGNWPTPVWHGHSGEQEFTWVALEIDGDLAVFGWESSTRRYAPSTEVVRDLIAQGRLVDIRRGFNTTGRRT